MNKSKITTEKEKNLICFFKGEEKKKFNKIFNIFLAYNRSIERLSLKAYESEKAMWKMLENHVNVFKEKTFRYDYATGKVYKV